MRASDPLESVDINPRKAVTFAAAAVVLVVLYAMLFPTAVAIVAMALSLPIMIFLHELGHFTMAKRTGMKVTEFFVGFGPRLWSFRRGETEYGIKAIPLGGYCKVIGMTNLDEVDPDDEPRTYRSKSWHARVGMAAAGPVVHFLIAIVLTFAVLFFAGDYRAQRLSTTLDKTSADAAAQGLRPGDKLVSIEHHDVTNWDQVHALISPPDHPATVGKKVEMEVRRQGRLIPVTVTLSELKQKDAPSIIGAGLQPRVEVPSLSVGAALVESPKQVFDVGWASIQALGHVFSPSGLANYYHLLVGDKVSKADQSNRFLSPVGYVQVSIDAVKAGWVTAFGLLIAINVFIGLFNLLPLLPFDGGHIAIATYEKIASSIRGRRVQVDITKLMPIAVAVMAVLGFILLSSLYLDAARGVPNPF